MSKKPSEGGGWAFRHTKRTPDGTMNFAMRPPHCYGKSVN